MEAPSLYPRLLGSAWLRLDGGVRDIHGGQPETRLLGSFEIQASRTRLGRLFCLMARLPRRSGPTECDVLFEASVMSERWSRSMGPWKFASTQLEEEGLLVERVGLLDLRFRLTEERAGIRFTQVGAYLRAFGVRVPIPRILAPRVVALELPGSDGRTLIDITLSLPLVGTLVRYHGEVEEFRVMVAVLWLLAAQGVLGAFDTVYYHEWKARLPGMGRDAASELIVHALRDFLYAVLFASLPWFAWRGTFAVALVVIIGAEIGLTFLDFVIEKRVRRPLGDVFGGERVTHGAMAVIYGAALANLAPSLLDWWRSPTVLAYDPVAVPVWVRVALTTMGAGVALSGVRDLYAALGPARAGWPWSSPRPSTNSSSPANG